MRTADGRSVRRRFEPFNARSQVGEGQLQSAQATIQLSMGELDHRLRIGEAAPHFVADVLVLALNLLVELRDNFGDKSDFLLDAFEFKAEKTACLLVSCDVLLPQKAACLLVTCGVPLPQKAACLLVTCGVLLPQKAARLLVTCGVLLLQKAARLLVTCGVLLPQA